MVGADETKEAVKDIKEKQEQGIQLTLFEYFQDADRFSLAEAKELILEQKKQSVKEPSIRARIY